MSKVSKNIKRKMVATKPKARTITGSRALDLLTHPHSLIYKATDEYVKQKKDLDKGIYRDPFAGKIRTRS